MQVLNVHGAVACAEMCMEHAQLRVHVIINVTESIAQLKDTDHTRSYDNKNTLMHSVEAVWQVGPGAVSVFVVVTEGHFLVLC